RAPAATSSRAISRPRPREPPVITATRSRSWMGFRRRSALAVAIKAAPVRRTAAGPASLRGNELEATASRTAILLFTRFFRRSNAAFLDDCKRPAWRRAGTECFPQETCHGGFAFRRRFL